MEKGIKDLFLYLKYVKLYFKLISGVLERISNSLRGL
jgi:hypothetical protein